MKEVFGNIWEYPADCIGITTNGNVNSLGKAIMGKGIALQAKRRFLGIETELGELLQARGNIPFFSTRWFSFPTKINWQERASLSLIRSSANTLGAWAKLHPDLIYVLPRPGCGLGGRDWETEVRPIVLVLPDNVHIIELEVRK